MIEEPFYNPQLSYEDNYENGPFGAFADGKIFEQTGEPHVDFHGYKVYSPFGIPPGPLLNSNFIKAAWDKGFDITVYKTVRTRVFPCHPWPNVVSVDVEGDLTLEKTASPLHVKHDFHDPISITNSFGVPSKDPDVWQADVAKAVSVQKPGQVLVLSFMGTVWEGQTEAEFIGDYAKASALALETKAPVLETNLSCPNLGNEGLVCYNIEMTRKVCSAIRNVIGNTPFVIKIGYFTDQTALEQLAMVANEFADDVAAINTIQAAVVDDMGNPALPSANATTGALALGLPGPNRLKSGICGASIKWAGLDMVRRLKKLKDENGYKFAITGVGGVMTPVDYQQYRAAGADVIMSATGAMWNPYLAEKIKVTL